MFINLNSINALTISRLLQSPLMVLTKVLVLIFEILSFQFLKIFFFENFKFTIVTLAYGEVKKT